MADKFSPEPDDQMPEKKSSQQLLLLLLLLLIVLFAYLYFFTGLIKPRPSQPQPPAPEALVKKPLPPRSEQKGTQPAESAKPAKPAAKEQKPGAPAIQEAKPAPHASPAGKEKPVPAAGGADHAKPAKSLPPASQAKGVKPALPAKEAMPAPVAAKKPAAPASETAKTAQKPVAAAKTAPSKPSAPETTAAGKGSAPAVAAKPAVVYTLEIVGDLAESEISPVAAKLKKAGINRLEKIRSHKTEPMHRLFLADFANRDEALEELERLKLATADAFMLQENQRYAVYAGSYMREAKAATEQKRLLAKGVQLLQKSATAQVPVVRVRAGSFSDHASAERAVSNLKKQGVSAQILKLRR